MAEFSEDMMIAAPPARVWAILADLEHWPTWTAAMTRVECLDPGPPAIGARVRISQPRMRPAVWEIEDWRAGEGFTWSTARPGLRVVASHELVAREGGCVLRLRLRFEGLLGGVVAWVAGGLTRKYMAQEARGLRRQAEAELHESLQGA